MSEKSKNECGEKYKKIKNQNDKNPKKMFLIKISPKNYFRDRNCNFQNLRGHENIKKSCVNNNASIFQSKNPKTYWFFSYFCEPVRTIWHDPSIDLELSYSYLFFRLHCDHFRVPNDHFCFSILVIFQIKSSPILTRPRSALHWGYGS